MRASFLLGADGVYRCADLQHFLWQAHGFGTRLAAAPSAAITLRQVHSNIVWNAHPLTDREREGDALVTDEPERTIGVRTADCVPVLLLDTGRRAVGAVHAGWRGTVAGIVPRAIEKMAADFGAQHADVYAAIGPCVRQCCYEVGPEVAVQFAPWFPELASATGKSHIDLAETIRRQLLAVGVTEDRILDSCLCTVCNPEHFFSFRRQPEEPGRMLSSICRLA